MKIRLVTVGEPKLQYAKLGWRDYAARLSKLHSLKIVHVQDKYAYDTKQLLSATEGCFRVAMVIGAQQLSSERLAQFLETKAQHGQELAFIIGGPEGLPEDFIDKCDYELSLSELTLPHDLAMVVTAETLYRSSTINSGYPYHK